MTHRRSNIPRALTVAGLIAAFGLPALAQGLPPVAAPMAPDPTLQPGYERSPQTMRLNQSMLEQIERNPGAPMAAAPFTVQPGATVTYPPRVQPDMQPQR